MRLKGVNGSIADLLRDGVRDHLAEVLDGDLNGIVRGIGITIQGHLETDILPLTKRRSRAQIEL